MAGLIKPDIGDGVESDVRQTIKLFTYFNAKRVAEIAHMLGVITIMAARKKWLPK
jgi:hypothetical protein